MKRPIYAEDAMERIRAETRFCSGTYANIERAIDTAPTVEPEKKSARWKNFCDFMYKCTSCGAIYVAGKSFKYCPDCGARMVNSDA